MTGRARVNRVLLEAPIDYSKARPMPRLKPPVCMKCGFCLTCDGCQCPTKEAAR